MNIPSPKDILPVKKRAAWRAWLEKNHATKQAAWVLFYKKHTGRASLPYNDAVEEALCFGWIDSVVKKLDEDSYIQKFTPRRSKSAWSPSNKQRVRTMIRLGKMTSAGLAKIAAAKKDGSWTRLDAVERLTSMPAGFAAALRKAPAANRRYRGLSPSHQKQFLWFIESARREETKKKRMAIIVNLLAENRTMSDYFYGKQNRKGQAGPIRGRR